MEKQELPKPNFSHLLNSDTLGRPNDNSEYLWKKPKSSQEQDPGSRGRSGALWRRKVLTVITISLPLSVCLAGRPLLLLLHGSHWSNPAEVGARCGYRFVAEISITARTMVQIKGEKCSVWALLKKQYWIFTQDFLLNRWLNMIWERFTVSYSLN